MPSFAVIRSPLKSPRDAAGTAPATTADSAESIRTERHPYSTSTANSSHTRPSTRTSASTAVEAARTTFVPTSSGLRGNRSATAPSSGPNSTGSQTANSARAANASEPVSDLTQIPAASRIAELPNPETTTAARNSPAVRSRRTRPTAITPTAPF